jgi:hypothetical protein
MIGVISGPPEVAAKPLEVSVALSPMYDSVVLCVEGREPIGLSPQAALTLAVHLSDAVQQLMDAGKGKAS